MAQVRALAIACFVLAAPSTALAGFGNPQPLSDPGPGSFTAAGAPDGAQLVVLRSSAGDGLPHLLERVGGGPFTDAGPVPGTDARSSSLVVAASRGSHAGVAWREDSPRKYSAIQVLLREPVGGAVTIAGPEAGGVRYPALGVDGLGGAVLAYSTGTGATHLNQRGRVAIAFRRPGEAWSRPRTVTATIATPPAVAVAPNGEAIVAWIRNGRFEIVSVTGGRIGRVKSLGPASREFDLAIGAAGRAVVAWRQRVRGGVVIWAATRAATGVFSRARLLSRAAFSRAVDVEVNDDGRALVAWNDEDFTRTAQRRPRGYNGVYSRVFATIGSTRGARFARPQAISPGWGYAGSPRVAAVGGGFAAVWFFRFNDEASGLMGKTTTASGDWERSQFIGPELLQSWEAANVPQLVGAGPLATALWSQLVAGSGPGPQPRAYFADGRLE